MKNPLLVVSLVLLLCFAFGCQKGENIAKSTLEQTKIAFASYRDGNFEIYFMNPDGSKQTNLTNNPAYDGYPSWVPFLKTEKWQLGMEPKPANWNASKQIQKLKKFGRPCFTDLPQGPIDTLLSNEYDYGTPKAR